MRIRLAASLAVLPLALVALPSQAATPTVVADRAPTRSLSTAGSVGAVHDFAVGADGRLYVAGADEVAVYPAGATGSASPSRVLDVPLEADQEAILVTVDGDGWVTVLTSSGSSENHVVVFNPSGVEVRDYPVSDLGVVSPVAMSAVGDEVAIVDLNANAVDVFDLRAGTTTASRTIPGGDDTTTLVNPYAIASDAAGRLYVAGFQTYGETSVERISVFAPGADGAATRPVRYLTGAQTRLGSFPTDLAVDRTGAIYAATVNGNVDANPSRPRIVRFAPGATGNIAPTAVLQGPRSRLGSIPTVDVAPDLTLRTVAFDTDLDGASVVQTHRPLGPYAKPDRPTGLTITGRGTAQRTITWKPVPTNADTPIRAYAVGTSCRRDGKVTASSRSVAGTRHSLTFRTGGPGRCTVRVTARNVVGIGVTAKRVFLVKR